MYCVNLLKQLLADDSTKDLTVTAKDGKPIRVHKAILLAKCTNLKDASDAIESGNLTVSANSACSVELAFDFLYTGSCALDSYNVVDIMCLGSELGFAELVQATSDVIVNELKLLNPSTAFILLDSLSRKLVAARAISEPTHIVTDEIELCEKTLSSVLGYISRNAQDVLSQAATYISVNHFRFIPETIKVVLRRPYLTCNETLLMNFLDAWAGSKGTETSPELLQELYGMIDLEHLPPQALVKCRGHKAIPKDRYVQALEHLAAPQQQAGAAKHRDHGRFAVGHTLHEYPGYHIVETLEEFVTFLPEVLRQYEHEGGGLPLLEKFSVTRVSLGIKEGFLAVGWDPQPILVKSNTVDFLKVGEHSGDLVTLMVRGYPSVKSLPVAGNLWDVNPTFLSAHDISKDKNERPALFVRVEEELEKSKKEEEEKDAKEEKDEKETK